jgi:citrate/tricarballylate utilization protein
MFRKQDLKYLANLCHNCSDCYYACQYAPPHDFDLNFPRVMGELRLATYREFAWPNAFGSLFGCKWTAFSLGAGFPPALFVLFAFIFHGPSALFYAYEGTNSFYRIIPYPLIVWPFSLLGLYVLVSLLKGFMRFWNEMRGRTRDLLDVKAHLCAIAIRETLQLKYLDGGGVGCIYPGERFSRIRKWFHHQVFYGFMLCLFATAIASIHHHFFSHAALYPSWYLPLRCAS